MTLPKVNSNVLKNKRADYGKRIVVTLSRQLTEKYDRGCNVFGVNPAASPETVQ
ncbi:MAG: hypothetical protein LBK75_07585 [Oscillospiraceae bacterium]|nr:hypothetical protein [Oscillospiraceae bacterium]